MSRNFWPVHDRHDWKSVQMSLLAFLILVLCACRPAATPTAERTTSALPAIEALPEGWTKIEPGGETRCAHDTPYAYWVRPGSTNNLFVYFQGGGGCSDAETCRQSENYKGEVTDNDNPDFTIGGIFDLNNPANPFNDYTMLFVPYCTGDVHAGNRVVTYTPDSGEPFDIYHRGFVNASAAFEWVYANFEQPDSIFMSGCSAGALGSMLYTPHVIRHYPETAVTQLGDSGGGLVLHIEWDIADDYDAGQYFPDWIPGMQEDIAKTFTVAKYYNALAKYYPDYTFAQYNSAADKIQTRYYVADGGSADDYPATLQASLDAVAEHADNFRFYTAQGDHHCVLKTTKFYTEENNGIRVRDWVADLANQINVENVQ